MVSITASASRLEVTRRFCSRSAYALTRSIDHADWSPEAIRARHAQWAQWAV